MQRISKDIKSRQFKNIYALIGPEAYLRKQFRDKLIAALVEEEDSFNYQYVHGKALNIQSLIDFSETLPFMADYRVIVLEDTKILKQGSEDLSKYLDELSETTIWIIVDEEFDKRNKLYKKISKIGTVVELTIQKVADLKRWVAGLIKKEGKNITENNLDLFLEVSGNEMSIIANELEKLFCYTLNKDVISSEDIIEVCIPKITGHIFDMIDAIALKKQTRAMDLYQELIELREPPIRILFLLGRHLNILLQTKELKAKSISAREMAEKIGIPAFSINKYLAQANNYKSIQLKSALNKCLEADFSIKSGKLTEKISVELLILSLMSE